MSIASTPKVTDVTSRRNQGYLRTPVAGLLTRILCDTGDRDGNVVIVLKCYAASCGCRQGYTSRGVQILMSVLPSPGEFTLARDRHQRKTPLNMFSCLTAAITAHSAERLRRVRSSPKNTLQSYFSQGTHHRCNLRPREVFEIAQYAFGRAQEPQRRVSLLMRPCWASSPSPSPSPRPIPSLT